MESNHRPHAYQACALTIWAMSPYVRVLSRINFGMSFTLKFLMYYVKVHWKINNKIPLNLKLFLLRKEVIQPHLPIRLPCYDFTPIIDSTFDRCLFYKLAHGLRVFPTLMVWRAVCTRPGNVFTAVCWPAITSNSGFMKANFSLQSELRLLLEFRSTSRCCFSLLQPL